MKKKIGGGIREDEATEVEDRMDVAKHGGGRDQRFTVRHGMGGDGGRHQRQWPTTVSSEPAVDLRQSVGRWIVGRSQICCLRQNTQHISMCSCTHCMENASPQMQQRYLILY